MFGMIIMVLYHCPCTFKACHAWVFMTLNIATGCRRHRDWASNVGLSRLGPRSWTLEIEPSWRLKKRLWAYRSPRIRGMSQLEHIRQCRIGDPIISPWSLKLITWGFVKEPFLMTHVNLVDSRMLFLTGIHISALRQDLYVNKYSMENFHFITHVCKSFCRFFLMF
jgi:hypothetical protein